MILSNTRFGLLLSVMAVGALLESSLAQNDQGSLGDLARKTRAEKTSKEHVAARHVLNEETLPKANWQRHGNRYWATMPSAFLSVLVPAPNRPAGNGVEVPLEHSGILMAFGDTIWGNSFNDAANEYVRMLLTRSRYYGATVKLAGVEDTTVAGQRAMLIHFNFMSHSIPHRGIALFVSAPEQIMSVGCLYRDVDSEKAAPICEEIINSAEIEIPTDYKLMRKPTRY